jgi:hypothetical protein
MLKIKQEATGYPSWVLSEDDKNRYIREYNEREGILLDKNNIKPNLGLKALSKLLLNSRWGRYAMQTLKTSCKFITSYQELLEYFNNIQFEVKNLLFPSDHVAMLLYQDNKEMHRQSTLVRNKNDWSLRTKTSDKIYRMVYDKRIICDDFSTLPYGF